MDDQQTLLDGLGSDLAILHLLALGHLGLVALGCILVGNGHGRTSLRPRWTLPARIGQPESAKIAGPRANRLKLGDDGASSRGEKGTRFKPRLPPQL